MSQSPQDDDYLWNQQGPVDPEVERLENLLSGLRYEGAPPQMPAQPARQEGRPVWAAAVVAAAVILVTATWWWTQQVPPDAGGEPEPPHLANAPAPWSITDVHGQIKLDGTSAGADQALRPGQWLQTGSDTTARVQVADIGHMDLGAQTKLRLKHTSDDQHRLELAQGHLHAWVVAPPRLFFVETPGATAVDLGCEYTLDVDEMGHGAISVLTGYVSLERPQASGKAQRGVFVPAGTTCQIHPTKGPGVPHHTDAEPAVVSALEGLDGSDEALDRLLAACASRDTLALFHLLPRLEAGQRERTFARLRELTPPVIHPDGVTTTSVLKLNPVALDAWQDALLWLW